MRYLTNEIERLFTEEQKICLIAGPRQVGKTTLAKYLLENHSINSMYFNWDIVNDRKLILKYPSDFWLRKEPSAKQPLRLTLDEIHKFPRWKTFLKGLYDAHKEKIQLIVTGSGKLDIFQKGGDSLFGRYQLYHLLPFTAGELLSKKRSIKVTPDSFINDIQNTELKKENENALHLIENFTGFPEPLFSESATRLRRWSLAHEQLILREELRDLTRIRELGLIEALVNLLPERIGSPLSINALREDLNVRFETVQLWLNVLERLFFLFSIRPYAGKLARTLRREEKIYLFDFSTIPEPSARFENIVGLHLFKLCKMWTEFGYGVFNLHYVRDREKREVDFLITLQNKPFALIEAKLKASKLDTSLLYFKERLKPKYAIQIVRNPEDFSRAFISNGILLAPAVQALAVM